MAVTNIKGFYFNPKDGGFYYRPTGERWVFASIKAWFTPEDIEAIKRQKAPPPSRLIGFKRGRRRLFA
jgi:hypothetical protein